VSVLFPDGYLPVSRLEVEAAVVVIASEIT